MYRQENDRVNMELDRMRSLERDRDRMMGGPSMMTAGVVSAMADTRVGVDMYGRSRSPDPRADPSYATRVAAEVADLKDKLETSQTELRRSQAELRLNQGDYERSHVELEGMQEKVSTWLLLDGGRK